MTDIAKHFPLLAQVDSPADLRQLDEQQLPQLAAEIRRYIIETFNKIGGHFGGAMGAVEIAIALHYAYNTPDDRLVWDVGHQAHPHKILTGRRDRFATLKQPGGLAPFPHRDESEYDCFGVGHSSTSISAALGMAIAAQMDNQQQRSVAIIGDGGLTGGMAFEALNHGGALDPDLLVILNDNEMSISENVGALTHYLGRILSSKMYSSFREGSKKILNIVPPLSRLVKRTETHLKGMVTPGSLFEELGFNYTGPIDGHDLPTLIKTLRTLKTLNGAKLLHVITTKGKGYAPAEQDPIKYHAVKPGFYTKTTQQTPNDNKSKPPTYSQIFGQWLCDMAERDANLIAITPAMCEGSGMVEFAKRFPNNYQDVSIAEQHSVTFAAGLACEGKKPIVAIYSTFLQRAYDQLIHDVALQNLDVTFAIDRAGLVADGPTHAGVFDLSYLRCIPNMVVMAPADENECRQMLYTAYQHPGPAAVRYPRGTGPNHEINQDMHALPLGKGIYCRHGKQVAILAFGSMVNTAIQAAEQLNATVVNMRFIKPLDAALIEEVAQSHQLIVTLEENVVMGGAGSAVSECLSTKNIIIPVLHLGWPDCFSDHGSTAQMLTNAGLDAPGIMASIQKRLNSLKLVAP